MNFKFMHKQNGFTLVELSIVIIIIGFLIAGISSGKSLIDQARLNSIIDDMRNYQIAYLSFKNVYSQTPGDTTMASVLFPNCAAPVANCNGNGDGKITIDGGGSYVMGSGTGSEPQKVWAHLYNAKLINNSIIPLVNGNGGAETIGQTSPEAKISGSIYYIVGGGTNFIGTLDGGQRTVYGLWQETNINAIYVAVPQTQGISGGVLTPLQTYQIDKKIDDGNEVGGQMQGANTGFFRAGTGGSIAHLDCINGTTYNFATDTATCIGALQLN